METRAEGNVTRLGLDLDVTDLLVKVGGDDDVDVLDHTLEVLEESLLLELELKETTIDLLKKKIGYYIQFFLRGLFSSTLLTIRTGLMRSVRAWRSTVSVWTQTPSTVSTTTRAPSVTRRAAVT